MVIRRRDLLASGGSLLAGAALGFIPARSALAHEYDVGKLKVEHPWLRAPADGEKNASFYAFLHNAGDTPDKLVAVKVEKFGKAVVHGDAKNLELETPVVLPPKSKVTLAPGGVYVALLDAKKHLEIGWGLEMTLVFEKAGEVVVDAAIDAPDAKHAHDAEAMERWEKAHNKDTSGPKESAGHEAHHGHEGHHHSEKPEGAK
ncbi:copper chaperone PCu(A)C [Methylocystis echinoides]|uniref:copper chaperone PCu(A)C n=1 Tax=Methylocystis echinoides TaxID=29468 RepID=UPI003430B95B